MQRLGMVEDKNLQLCIDARDLAAKLVPHLIEDLVGFVVERVQLGLDSVHVVGQHGSAVPHVVAGDLRLLKLAASQDVGDRDLETVQG